MASEKLPASHSVGATAPEGQKLPAVHNSQAVEPVVAWNEPAWQAEHMGEPGSGDTVPAAQGDAMVAPGDEEDPAGHSVQLEAEDWPGMSLYVPASHRVTAAAPVGQKPPAAHVLQAVCPLLPWKVPASQPVQEGAPEAAATLPAAQSVGSIAPREQDDPAVQE